MRTIRVSEEVWQAIAQRGKFGEIEEDVLRRLFDLPIKSNSRQSLGRRKTVATRRMTSYISNNHLFVGFQDETPKEWPLPDKKDKLRIRVLFNEVINFTRENGASLGQTNAARKTLTSEGYHLTK